MSVSTPELRDAKVRYGRDGWLPLPFALSDVDVKQLRDRIEEISTQRRPEVVYEEDSPVVRALHGCHDFDDVCHRLVRLPVFLDYAETILGGPVYVYQFKVNMKQAREGAAWPWHQDFVFWHREDGMPDPHAVNIAVFLDDVYDTNGPLEVIPGSHHLGLIDVTAESGEGPSHDWHAHVSAKLEYTVPDEVAEPLAATYGTQRFTGSAGSVVAFHPNLVHSSSNNLSDYRRSMLLITYNKVSNAPAHPTRPEFLVSRDTTPVVRVDDNHL
ncbi:phytanoyl-CoA dioxygenase family protein [Streptomyces sp. PR69]|uniref:phytanoyl-CoA dioxygenase family protein n=1 Tax=Streptomyces sp. PR69 TaxID=2984950 RepID=UPI0022640F27|nr:phytanoyl-CoA dioxygenase family protein [Streptomyces sp. PR69]